MEPPSRCVWMPFGFAMRHELGSKGRLSPADISCYLRQVIEICSVILCFNKLLTNVILTNTVERSGSKVCVSNRKVEQTPRYRSAAGVHMAPMQSADGTNSASLVIADRIERCRRRCRNSLSQDGCRKGLVGAKKETCDKASPARAVMLHLRARYVSKAAILTISVPSVPVENRSPA
jgi:hypothetical protein